MMTVTPTAARTPPLPTTTSRLPPSRTRVRKEAAHPSPPPSPFTYLAVPDDVADAEPPALLILHYEEEEETAAASLVRPRPRAARIRDQRRRCSSVDATPVQVGGRSTGGRTMQAL